MEEIMKKRFNPMLKFFSNERTGRYFNGEKIYPINIEFSPSGVCPANCRKCFYRANNNELHGLDGKFFDLKRFKKLVQEFKACNVKSISWTGGGEPTSHPNFAEMSRIVHEAGIEQGLFTNALRPISYDPSLMRWIRVTKTNFPFPEEHIKQLRGCRTLGLCINYAVGDERFIDDGIRIVEELDKMKSSSEQATYLQIRPELNIMGALHETKLPEIKHPLIELTPKEAVTEYGRGYEDCEGYHFTPFIWQDGKISVCAYHKDNPAFELGNLYERNFQDIMDNAPKSVKVIPTCQACCKLHEMNKAIEERKNLDDINFI
jgi:GTP 3',8-cyclase